MPPHERELSLRDYWRIVARRKWIVVAALALSVLASLLLSFMQQPIYQAESQMLVEPRLGGAVFEQDPTLNVQNLERAIQTEIQVLEGQRVRQRVQDDLGLAELPPTVAASAVGSTDVVSVRVRSEDPEAAQRLADAYVDAYIAERREQAVANLEAAGAQLQATVVRLEEEIATATEEQREGLATQLTNFRERLDQLEIEAALTTGGASIVKNADLPTDPVEPTPLRSAALAGVLGLLLGLGAAFLVDYIDDSIRSEEDLEGLTETPVLAVVPIEPPPDNRPIALSEPHELAVEIYRGLRTNVQFLGLDRQLRTIQVTSSLPGEGKTTTATNLAVVLAQAGNDVVVVDADLRKPRVHAVFAVTQGPGLTDVLLGESVDMAIDHLGQRLHVVAAGTVPPNPSEMMSNARVAKLLEELARRYDYVIVDTAPVLPVADALALSRVVDGVLVVAQANRVSRRDVTETLTRLDRVGAPVFGIVLNQAVGTAERGTYGYGYGDGYRTAAPHDDEPHREHSLPPPASVDPAVVPANND